LLVVIGILPFKDSSNARLQLEVRRLNRKLDNLLAHHGIKSPSSLSTEAQALAKAPGKKIATIKHHRKQNPGLYIADAKQEIEYFFTKKNKIVLNNGNSYPN
jgi:ribosomal protein L7/L12